MKTKKQILAVIVLIILLLPTVSKANIEIKSGTTTWTNITVSEAYDVCKDLDMGGSSLGTDGLDPHLALNKDWGAVAYLAISASGAVTSETTHTGPKVTVDDRDYTTTTGNLTGVMDFGKTRWTFTSCSTETGLEVESSNATCRDNLIKNKTTRYVETLSESITKENTKGMALSETGGWFGGKQNYNPNANDVVLVRCNGVFGFSSGNYWNNSTVASAKGGGDNVTTFRPAIWNL